MCATMATGEHMKHRTILLTAMAAIVSCLASGADDASTPPSRLPTWREVATGLLGGGDLVKVLERAADLVASNPRDPGMRSALMVSPHSEVFEDIEDRKAAQAAAARIVHALQRSFEDAPHAETATNLLAVAGRLGQRQLLDQREAASADDAVGAITRWEGCTARLLVSVADYWVSRESYGLAKTVLAWADTLADRDEDPRRVRLLIAKGHVHLIAQRYGEHTRLAVPYLQRIVQLDVDFESHSNMALCRLGSIALAHGDIGSAKTYLALAGRVNLDPVLLSFGYERKLALELIEADHPGAAIEYLSIAFANEPKPHAKTVFGLGNGYLKKGEQAKAAKWFNMYVGLPGHKPHLGLVKKVLHSMQGGAEGQ